ncbi:MAG: tetratricopeptide repeat protein [Cyanobacteria bacterium P01_A01_bin.123]
MPTYRPPTLITPIALALSAIAAIASPAWSQSRSSHYLSDVQGTVEVGRYLITPDRAFNGLLVSNGHQIRVDTNSRVTLNCSNGSRHTFTSSDTYRVADYCPREASRRSGAINNPTRDPFNPTLPYLISPRNTVLLTAEEMILQWHPVEGAMTYTVSLQGPGVDWTTTVSETAVILPETVTFRPNYTYSVIVSADTGLSSAGDLPVQFAVLPVAEAERVQSQVAAIQAQTLEPDVEAIALALAYLEFEHSDPDWDSYALNQAALDVVEARIEAGTENPQIYLLQGEAYQIMSLPLLAQAGFQQALTLAEAANQQELQAQSHVGLANVAIRQTAYGEAMSHLQAAQELYKTLGDTESVAALQVRIDEIDAQRPNASS